MEIAYKPQKPHTYRPKIGLIGCGGITTHHLEAYQQDGYEVEAFCDVVEAAARRRRDDFYPHADIYTDFQLLLERDDIDVVDIATHPSERVKIIRSALNSGKHVLSQKPFALDLDEAQALVDLAKERGVKLAINQNGRWAPHFSYIRAAVKQQCLGPISSINMSVHWDHTWTAGTPFEKIRHLILYDFAIHWFDMVRCLVGEREARSVFAMVAQSGRQTLMPPLLAQAQIEFDGAIASLFFNADTSVGPHDQTVVVGERGSIVSAGPRYQNQSLRVTVQPEGASEAKVVEPELQGKWFSDGFRGTMGELLRSIEEDREPEISGADNLHSLALCFAAIESAETGQPVRPGLIRRMPGA